MTSDQAFSGAGSIDGLASWPRVRFSDVLVEKVRNGIYKPKEYHGSGTKIVNMGELFAYPRMRDVPMKRVQLSERELANTSLAAGDLLFARRSLVAEGAGKCSVVLAVDEPTTFESSIIRARPNPSIADSQYLYYFFNSPSGKHLLGSILRQTSVSGITGSDLADLLIPLPLTEKQRAIAHVLSTLDDKIELNRQMNQTLEQIAAALFKSWFVDFDPVRAKAEGRQPEGLDAETAALFPDRLVELELGAIPEGWQVACLDDIARFVNGLALQKHPPDGQESLPVIKIAQLRKGSTDGADRASARLDPEFIVDDGDVLFSWSGTLEVEIWAGGHGALNQHLFKVSSLAFPKWFYFLWTRLHLHWFRELARDKATTMGHIQRKHLTQAKVLVPDAKLLYQMDRLMSPILEAMLNNSLQSRTLMSLRDLLLPRLLSRESSVWGKDEQTSSGHQEGSQATSPEEPQLPNVSDRVVQSTFGPWSR